MGTLPYGAALGTDGNIKTGITSAIDGLLLSDLTEKPADGTDGVVFTYLDYDLSNGDYRFNEDYRSLDLKARFYAGILPTTNLGAPLKDGSADGTWDAQFAITYSRGARSTTQVTLDGGVTPAITNAVVNIRTPQTSYNLDTSILVNFERKSITTNTQDPANFTGAGSVIIDGNFTAEGVIYGNSSWVFDGQTSTGSVAGLIGSAGAVGAFLGDGTNFPKNNRDRTYGEYSGGFVAAPR